MLGAGGPTASRRNRLCMQAIYGTMCLSLMNISAFTRLSVQRDVLPADGVSGYR